MKAIEIIEAESPKGFFMQRLSGAVSTVKLANQLHPSDGWKFEMRFPPEGGPSIGTFSKDHQGKRWVVVIRSPGADIEIYRKPWNNPDPNAPWQYDETVKLSNMQYLMSHLAMFGLHNRKSKPVAENVLSLDQDGHVTLDDRPKAHNAIWSHQRKDKFGNPDPYRRIRRLPNGKKLELYVDYRNDRASTELLSKAKQYGRDVAKMATRGADDIAQVLQGKGITLVMALPSGKPLARRFARLIANRLGVPVKNTIAKSNRLSAVPIPNRRAVAQQSYSVEGQFRGQVVAIVDDYVVTSASQQAAAMKLYQAGARHVIGVALAI